MADELSKQSSNPDPDERPWQFSLLHLFGLMTVVCVGAAAFYWNPVLGTFVSCSLFLCIATFYRTKAVVHTAAPSLRTRSLSSLIGFAIFTSFVASFASLVAFCVTCTATGIAAVAFNSQDPWPYMPLACFLGIFPAIIVLYRSWPRRPAAK